MLMFIIEGHKENQKWISAIIKREKKAKDFLREFQERLKNITKFMK